MLHLAAEKAQLRFVLPRAHVFIRVAFSRVAAASLAAASEYLSQKNGAWRLFQ